MSKASRFFTVAFAVTALTVSGLAIMKPANAAKTSHCYWITRGTDCTQR